MKNFFFAVLMAVSFSAFAGQPGPASFAVEYEHENVEGNAGNINGISFIPGYKFENGIKLDVKLTGRQTDDTDTTFVAFEPRVKYMYQINDTFALGGRVSLGQALQDAGDHGFYTIEPIAEWAFTNRWLATTSMRFTDTFSDSNGVQYQSNTIYLGAGYKVTDSQTVSAKVYTRNNNGDVSDSNGIEMQYSIAF